MDYVAAHLWSFVFACLFAVYVAVYWFRRRAVAPPSAPDPGIRDADIEAELRAGRYAEAIRLYRRRDGSGLKPAKAAVDTMAQRLGIKA